MTRKILCSFVVMILAYVLPVLGASVEPQLVLGNQTCSSVGCGEIEIKIEPPVSGTYPLPDGINTITITTSGSYFDWTSTLGMDCVVVKGGPNANVYCYSCAGPEVYGDSDLHAPINPNNNNPYGLSHISLCYDYELDVGKNAETGYTRTYEWQIEKEVDPTEIDLLLGDTGTANYTVTVTKTGYTDSDWAVTGSIAIANNTPFDAIITGITDLVSPDISLTPDCGITLPYTLASGEEIVCTYGTALPDGSARTNLVTVTVASGSPVNGNSASAAIAFGEPTTEVLAEVNVTDTNGQAWLIGDTTIKTYQMTFDCEDEGQNPNTATIVETGQEASAKVLVRCWELDVQKDAEGSYKRTWEWTIEKSADQDNLTLAIGQQYPVNYSVYVTPSYVDGDWKCNGVITIFNPTPLDVVIASVEDVISPDIVATLDCGTGFPYTLASGDTLICTYEADLTDGEPRTNTATVTVENGTQFVGEASVNFYGPTDEIDECIDVNDTIGGFLGTVCALTIASPLDYMADVGPYNACGQYQVKNTASFVTNDTGATGEDSWTVNINVPCDGCTRTQGYWKTHSSYGPAPYDDTWAQVGEDTAFFDTGQSWYEVITTNPAEGNAYYILAVQYIAAYLNQLSGADTSAIAATMAHAAYLLDEYDGNPGSMDDLKPGPAKKVRADFIATAGILDDYNNGRSGPGHCDE